MTNPEPIPDGSTIETDQGEGGAQQPTPQDEASGYYLLALPIAFGLGAAVGAGTTFTGYVIGDALASAYNASGPKIAPGTPGPKVAPGT